MTLDDFLTLTLPKRIAWLHSEDGPRGKLSHDKFANALGIPNRQTVIGWEKSGREPNRSYSERLAEFSGFPAWAFRRREAEEAAWEMFGRRLGAVEEQADTHQAFLIETVIPILRKLAPDQSLTLEALQARPQRVASGGSK